MIKRFLNRFRWQWVGTVEGPVVIVDEDGSPLKSGSNKSSYWNLYERGDGTRRYEEVGNTFLYYDSQASRQAFASVKAWANGGPLPKLHSAAVPPKAKAKLIVFNGGKGGAA